MGTMRTRFCRPPREAQLLGPQLRHRLTFPPSTHAREGVPASRANFSPLDWQRERVRRLARICRCLDQGLANGKRLHEMLVWFAWTWKARTYQKCDPSQKGRTSVWLCNAEAPVSPVEGQRGQPEA